MALFGLIGKKSDADLLRKHAERVANRRAQPVDRWESIQALVQMRTAEAVAALLPRFGFVVDPTITDQEEKDAAFQGVVAAGEAAFAPVVSFLRKSESISWPLKMLEQIATAAVVTETLLALLSELHVEYERDPQRKIQMLSALEERKDPRIVPGVVRFTSDANETVRFHAVGALFAQPEAETQRDALLERFLVEDSVRIRNRILDGFAASGWHVGEKAAAVRAHLPAGYRLDPQGVPRRA